MIIEQATESDFHRAFKRMGRSEQFSREARAMLFEHLESYSEDSGEPLQLDVIALCCDFYESDAAELAQSYSECPQSSDFTDSDEWLDAIEEWLEGETSVVGRTGEDSFLYQAF